MKKVLWRMTKWLAAALLCALIVYFNRSEIEKARTQTFELKYLLLSGLLYLPCLVLTFYRWYLLVRAQDLPFRELDALRLGFVGNFFNQFLPGAVGGDLVKAGFIAREQQRRTIAVATVIVDRLVGLFGLMVLASLCGAFFWDRASQVEELRVIVVFVWALTAAGFALLFVPLPFNGLIAWLGRFRRPGRVLADVFRALQLYKQRLRALGLAVFLAVIGHVGFVLSYYFCAASVLPDDPLPSPADHYMIIPVGMVVQAVPVTPGNLGVSEGAFGYLYTIVGSTTLKGALASVAQRLVALVIALLGLIFYIPLRATVREVIAEQTELNPEHTLMLPSPAPEPTP